jgi:hypothetical protein
MELLYALARLVADACADDDHRATASVDAWHVVRSATPDVAVVPKTPVVDRAQATALKHGGVFLFVGNCERYHTAEEFLDTLIGGQWAWYANSVNGRNSTWRLQ